MCKPTFSVHVYDMKHPCSAFLSTPTRHKVFRKKLHGNMIELAAAHDLACRKHNDHNAGNEAACALHFWHHQISET